MRRLPLLLLTMLFGASGRLDAQQRDVELRDSVQTVVLDTARQHAGPGPGGAFWRSLLIPGWGQSTLGRHTVGGIFMAFEGIALAMSIKASQQADFIERAESGSESELLAAKRQERQDWLVLLVFNHLFAAAEAFVSAHLKDFPEELEIRAVPGGLRFEIPFP